MILTSKDQLKFHGRLFERSSFDNSFLLVITCKVCMHADFVIVPSLPQRRSFALGHVLDILADARKHLGSADA